MRSSQKAMLISTVLVLAAQFSSGPNICTVFLSTHNVLPVTSCNADKTE